MKPDKQGERDAYMFLAFMCAFWLAVAGGVGTAIAQFVKLVMR